MGGGKGVPRGSASPSLAINSSRRHRRSSFLRLPHLRAPVNGRVTLGTNGRPFKRAGFTGGLVVREPTAHFTSGSQKRDFGCHILSVNKGDLMFYFSKK